MPRNFTLVMPPSFFTGDGNEQLETGDQPASLTSHNDAAAFKFDPTDEQAIVSQRFEMPDEYTGSGTLKIKILFYMESDNTNDIRLEVFVEAFTPNTDTHDLEGGSDSFDSGNAGTVSLSGSTAGDPLTITIDLTNKDSVASGDAVRIGIRRDTDHADDDATGNLFLSTVSLFEE